MRLVSAPVSGDGPGSGCHGLISCNSHFVDRVRVRAAHLSISLSELERRARFPWLEQLVHDRYSRKRLVPEPMMRRLAEQLRCTVDWLSRHEGASPYWAGT